MTLFENICEVVCTGEGVTLDEIKTGCRNSEYNYPRQLIMYLARELKVGSFAVIGKEFNRDHATVLHACKSIQNYYTTDEAKRCKIKEYIEKLTGVREAIKMSDAIEQQIAPLKVEVADLQNKLINLQLLVNNIDTFVKELKL